MATRYACLTIVLAADTGISKQTMEQRIQFLRRAFLESR